MWVKHCFSVSSSWFSVLNFEGNERIITNKVLNDLILASAVEVKNDEFWDYDRQVDLESFNVKTLYDTLSKQSRSVTQTIGKHKDEMKQSYQRMANQSESLKGLWAAKMNLSGKCSLATQEDLASYETKLEDLEIELERRKEVGRRFAAILEQQTTLMTDDEKGRENHQVINLLQKNFGKENINLIPQKCAL